MTNKKILFLFLVLVVGFSWSWLFLIDVARLSSSFFTGILTMAVVFVINVGLTAAIIWYGSRHIFRHYQKPSWLNVFLIMASWAMLEFLASWLTALIWSGRGSSIDSVFPFVSLTPFLMYTPLRFLARFTGYYGLSAVVVTIIICLIRKDLRRYGAILSALVIIATGISYVVYRVPQGPTTKVGLSAETLGQKPTQNLSNNDIAVLPEYGLDDVTQTDIQDRFSGSHDIYFVGTQQKYAGNGINNNLIFGSAQQGIISSQSKTRLIAGGEYLPFATEVMLKNFDRDTYIQFTVQRLVARGKKPIHTLVAKNSSNQSIILGSEACSSVISTRDYRLLSRHGATLLTNSASLEIFNGSRLFRFEQRGLATFMAVANARPFVQSSNNWPAFAIDHNGNLLGQVKPNGVLELNIATNSRKTLYTMVGEWLVWIGFAALGYQILQRPKTKTTFKKLRKRLKKQT